MRHRGRRDDTPPPARPQDPSASWAPTAGGLSWAASTSTARGGPGDHHTGAPPPGEAVERGLYRPPQRHPRRPPPPPARVPPPAPLPHRDVHPSPPPDTADETSPPHQQPAAEPAIHPSAAPSTVTSRAASNTQTAQTTSHSAGEVTVDSAPHPPPPSGLDEHAEPEKRPDVHAQRLLALPTKRDQLRYAFAVLNNTDVTPARAFLAAHGVTLAESPAYRYRRELQAESTQESAPAPPPAPAGPSQPTPDLGDRDVINRDPAETGQPTATPIDDPPITNDAAPTRDDATVGETRPAAGPPAAFSPHDDPRPIKGQGAVALTEQVLLQPTPVRPTGWRAALRAASAGLINLGPSQTQRAHAQLLARIRRPLPGPYRIAVTSVKGGVGKTSVAACLGLTLAEQRPDRIITLDANTHAGTLYERITGQHPTTTIQDFLDDTAASESIINLGAYTTLTDTRLTVMAAARNPHAAPAFGDGEYDEVIDTLHRFYAVIITDCGTGLTDPVMDAVLAHTDTLIVVANPTVDAASRADATLDAISRDGHHHLVDNAITVLSHDRTSGDIDIDYLRTHFTSRCRALVEIPADRHLEHGGRIDPTRIHPHTQTALLTLADHTLNPPQNH
jgi:MinD-like ATPase involved in chromosome partitioning or flagellar assembly